MTHERHKNVSTIIPDTNERVNQIDFIGPLPVQMTFSPPSMPGIPWFRNETLMLQTMKTVILYVSNYSVR